MAFLVRRAANTLKNTIVRQLYTSTVRHSDYEPPAQEVMLGKTMDKGAEFPDALGYAVGEHRAEIIEDYMMHDFYDVFDYRMIRQNAGTREFPNMVPSMEDKRLIGCVCEEESHTIYWMELHGGEPNRCACGYWFQLVNVGELNTRWRETM